VGMKVGTFTRSEERRGDKIGDDERESLIGQKAETKFDFEGF
jgi:hypothetical protein